MQWDAVMIRAAARELDGRFRGSRVQAILLDPPAGAVALFLREATLVARPGPEDPTVTLLGPQEPPPGCQRLPAKIAGIEFVSDERVMIIHMKRIRGHDEGVSLLLEFTGAQANAILVGLRSGRVRAMLRRRSGRRALTIGQPLPPLGGARRRSLTALRSDDPGLLAPESGPSGADRRGILRSLAWSSPLNLPLLMGEGGDGAWQRLAGEEELSPGWLDGPEGPQPYPTPLPGGPWHPSPSFLDALEAAQGAVQASEGGSGGEASGKHPAPPEDESPPAGAVTDSAGEHYVPGAVLEALEGRVKAAGRKLRSLERELDSAPDPASLRGKGDLILARIGEIPRGASEVRLVDFDGQTVTLELDPSLDAAANARGYYDRAGRGERARRELPARIEEARTALAAEQSRLAAAREGTIPAEMVLEGLSRAGPGDKGGKGRTALPYRVFRSSGGLEIRVGRGARHNDTLTFQHARPMDVWLHARNVGGAHVVLRWDREERPPARDLEEAAVLAALNSRARTSGSVAVDWTRRKWVRKPRKGRPGQVLVERAETLFVAPDPQVGEALQVSEDGDQPDR